MGRARQTAGVLAKRARYDPRSKRLRIELESGVEVRIPVAKVQGLADAPAAVIRTVVSVRPSAFFPAADLP